MNLASHGFVPRPVQTAALDALISESGSSAFAFLMEASASRGRPLAVR